MYLKRLTREIHHCEQSTNGLRILVHCDVSVCTFQCPRFHSGQSFNVRGGKIIFFTASFKAKRKQL